MIRIENTQVMGWEAAIRGMRNPKNSWEKSDSGYIKECSTCKYYDEDDGVCRADDWSGQPINTENCYEFKIGPNDLDLMKRLAVGGPVHAKYRRMIVVYADITAPLYWWKEFDTYKVGTVANSCSTMHKLPDKEFTLDDFSHEHICIRQSIDILKETIDALNVFRDVYLNGGILKHENGNQRCYGKKDKEVWWQMIQLLPSSYNQKRTVMLDYEVEAAMYRDRRYHNLDEWREHPVLEENKDSVPDFASGKWGLCDWIKAQPYSELITGEMLQC